MNWRVPFVNYRQQFERQEPELLPLIREVLAGGDLIMRQHMLDFENNLAAFVGTQHGVAVSNCTDGIRLLAHALSVGAGDEVVTVAHTFVATMSPFALRGASPVLVDVGADHNMDVSLLSSAISDRTKVIVPVHLNGRPCRMDVISRVAADAGAHVIEDAAQALGARYNGKPAGTLGLASVYSFYPAKLLGAAGDAGAVLTDDAALAEELRALRDHYRVSKTELGGWGYNCRMDNLQAAILDFRLRLLPEWIERRREIALRYCKALAGSEVETLPAPTDDAEFFDVFQNFPVCVPNRDAVVKTLTESGIETLVSWPVPLHHQPGLGFEGVSLPRTEEICRSVVSLPMYPELENWQVDYVAETVLAAV